MDGTQPLTQFFTGELQNMLTEILICTIAITICLFIYLLIVRSIQNELKQRKDSEAERIKNLSATEEGRKILERENQLKEAKSRKTDAIGIPILFLTYFIFLLTGIAGIYFCIQELRNGEQISNIIFRDKGFYLFSPIFVISSIIKIFGTIKILFLEKKDKRKV